MELVANLQRKAVQLFVYGSLLAGEAQHARLGGSRLLESSRTVAKYTLVDLGAYPALLAGGTTSIFGEVYEVDPATLGSLDAFEGHPLLYRRLPIRLADGRTAAAYALRQTSLALGRPTIFSGDWRARTKEPARAFVTYRS